MAELKDEFRPLEEKIITIKKNNFGELVLIIEQDKEYEKVQIIRSFPYTGKDEFILLNDKDGKEIGIIEDISGLDDESRKVLEEELKKKYFIPRIKKVYDIQMDYRSPVWHVRTDKGVMVFKMRRRKDAKYIKRNHLVVKDGDGNKYEIPDVSKLDSVSQQLIEKEV